MHGARFAFKQPETWGTPDEVIELEDPCWGQVCLERWNGLHEKKGADVPYAVIRASVHLERSQPPAALWLAWLSPDPLPQHGDYAGSDLASIYLSLAGRTGHPLSQRNAGLDDAPLPDQGSGDHWSELTAIACWLLYLARPIVEDTPLPWQKPQQRLTPQRVQQSIYPIFALIGTPARPPKRRGKAPGWPQGRQRMPKQRYAVVKKTSAAAKMA